jgi:hypothetical protein
VENLATLWKNRHCFDTEPYQTRNICSSTVRAVDETEKVLRRLERIEALERERAPAARVLDELRELVREGRDLGADRGRRRRTGGGRETSRGGGRNELRQPEEPAY